MNNNGLSEPSITLYRILGNDLPPLHSFAQTITNLVFLLNNEPSFPNVTKIWILNRIVDSGKEKVLINILEQYKQLYLRIPFNWDEYRQIPFYFSEQYPNDDFFNSTQFAQLESMIKITLIEMLYYKKNLYAINNNGARNFALRHGKQETQSNWLMVFDGNCFLSKQGYDLIRDSIVINGSRFQYFIVPMIRLVSNSEIDHRNITKREDEPQIIFRQDSSIEYSDKMPYGQRPKIELLSYLGVMKPIPRLAAWTLEGRQPIGSYYNEAKHLFQKTSFVLRLSSGTNPVNAQSSFHRSCTRYESVISFLADLDYQITGRHLLPERLKDDSRPCKVWSDEQISNFVKTVRQSIKKKSVEMENKSSNKMKQAYLTSKHRNIE